jgi:hypothetical protein
MTTEEYMDLTKSFPRSGEETLGGYPWLPRCIDKCRAYLADTLGDYIFPCPIDKELLAELDLTVDEFMNIVAGATDDNDVLEELGLPAHNTIRTWPDGRVSSLKTEGIV